MERAKLKLLHGAELIRRGSFDYWSRQPTGTIVNSLAPHAHEPLIVKADGTVMQGNTRIAVLMERGYDVDALQRVAHASEPIGWEHESSDRPG